MFNSTYNESGFEIMLLRDSPPDDPEELDMADSGLPVIVLGLDSRLAKD